MLPHDAATTVPPVSKIITQWRDQLTANTVLRQTGTLAVTKERDNAKITGTERCATSTAWKRRDSPVWPALVPFSAKPTLQEKSRTVGPVKRITTECHVTWRVYRSPHYLSVMWTLAL